jgi:CRISPR/Cas system-associated exonuclease Cas4 (RecB family)
MKINIADVVSKYVKLNKLGPGYTGICPFCEAKGVTDFVVLVRNQKYACAKCHAEGGIFKFLMDLKGISLEEALTEIKEIFNITFDGYYLDSQWNKYLKDTDFQNILRSESEKIVTFLRADDSDKHEKVARSEPISYTELATFIRCPLEYKLRYRDRANNYQPIGTRVNVGRFLHSVATQFLKQAIDERIVEFIEIKFREELATKRNAEYIDELERFKEPTAVLLQALGSKAISDKSPNFKTKFDSFTIWGAADCLLTSDTGIQIVEFKEYDYREFDEDVHFMRYLQLLFYFLGLGGREVGISVGTYCFFSNGHIDEVVFTDEVIDQAKEFIRVKLKERTDCKVFTPKLNALCISCGYRDKCKLYIDAKGRI